MTLQDLFKDHQLYHSDFQMDNLITVRAGGTLYGQYKQALRELFKRYRGLKQLYTEKELLQVDIDELQETTTTNKFENRRNAIKVSQKIMSMEELDKNIEDTEREFKRFYAQAVSLKQHIGDLTPEQRDKLDREMWEYKLKEMAAIDFVAHGRLSNVTYEMLVSAPVDMRGRLLKDIQDHNRLLTWYESKADITTPQIEQDFSVKKLLEG